MKQKFISLEDKMILNESYDKIEALFTLLFGTSCSEHRATAKKSINYLVGYYEGYDFEIERKTIRNLKNSVVVLTHHSGIIIELNKYREDSTGISIYYNNHAFYENEEIIKSINKFINNTPDPRFINLIMTGYGGLTLDEVLFKSQNINIDLNYNDDFKLINEEIVKHISENKAGIHLIHGVPGSGKSSYVKYLIDKLPDKKFIYCPSSYTSHLSSPDFLKLMISQGRDGVLIIEDAEEALVSDNGRSAAISNLLNMSDGILGDALNIQIIATFNTETSNIDPALMRKGRLLTNYKFTELSIEKSQILYESLGHKGKINSPMTLADLYNFDKENYEIKKNKIGL